MHKIEKELSAITEVKREKNESDQEFFKRLLNEGSKMFDKDENLWAKLSENSQRWFNAASEADEGGKTIPNYDGEVAEDEEGDEDDGGDKTVESKAVEEPAAKAEGKASKKAGKAEKATPPKKAAAGKPAPAKAKAKSKSNGVSEEPARRGRKGSFSPTDKIKKVAAKDPFREGSKASKCFQQYKVGRTVQQILDAGVPRSKLNRHMNKGIVTIG